MNERYSLPIPFGWFAVALSSELAKGEVKALHYFNQELVLFRTESGEAKVLEAYCPHLGAHLGHGGTVQGESIACPFHGWQFNGDGFCTDVPYAKKKPSKVVDDACIKHFPCKEDNGAVWVWYHPNNEAPHWELDHIDEIDNTEFWSQTSTKDWIINCHIQDTNENAVDKAHFAYVHTSEFVPDGDVLIEGHLRSTEVTSQVGALDDTGNPIEGKYVEHSFISNSFGPGFTFQRFIGMADSIMIGMITPITEEKVHLRFLFLHPELKTDLEKLFNQGFIDHICNQVEEDINIWNNKRYAENPILCDGDGPINQFRNWFSQFYAG